MQPHLLFLALILLTLASSVSVPASPQVHSFRREPERDANRRAVLTRVESLAAVRGVVRAYATFDPLQMNPSTHTGGQAAGAQELALGQWIEKEFVIAIRFGVRDSGRGPDAGRPLLALWAHDGSLDHFGDFARPEAPCDFKLTLDLERHRVSVWTARRGDDRWFLLLDAARVDPRVTAVDAVRVEQHPGAPGIRDLVVQDRPWKEAEAIRDLPPGATRRRLTSGAGFRFQQMRSTWRSGAGRHVTLVREPPVWFGFPEVVLAAPNTLVVAHNDGRQHGGGGGLFVRRSEDLGKTWESPVRVHPSGINCPRLQVLADGSLLLLADLHGAVGVTPLYRSADTGRTWVRLGELDAVKAGGHAAIVPSQVLELPDGAWLIVGSWYPGGKPWEGKEGEQLEFFRSTDRGVTWKLHSTLQAFPDHRHSLSEASLLPLKDGRVVMFAREGRGDGFPGVQAFSGNEGRTWDVRDLPFAVTGRTHAGFLPDGRVMLTFRSGIGRQALWAWVGDPMEAPPASIAAGVHFNDARSVGLKNGELHLEHDGRRGQFTHYLFRPPGERMNELAVTAEVKVVENAGLAATISVPFAGFLRLYPDRVELHTVRNASHPQVPITPGRFHTYHIVVRGGHLRLSVDGQERLVTDQLDGAEIVQAWTPSRASVYGLGFGCERRKDWGNHDRAVIHPDVWDPNISPDGTGYSIWRRFEGRVGEPGRPERTFAWNARTGEFPDQYQLDHIVEVEASVAGHDQGYSGWTLLPDGRIFVVNYTDDTAPLVRPGAGGGDARMGIAWLRGTYLSPRDLPKARN